MTPDGKGLIVVKNIKQYRNSSINTDKPDLDNKPECAKNGKENYYKVPV